MHEVRREMSDAWAYGRATSRFRKKITKLMVTFIFEDFKGSGSGRVIIRGDIRIP